jgi:hypothetical protein
MNRDEILRSTILIVVLLSLAVLIAQSQRECEIPGSSWVPLQKRSPTQGSGYAGIGTRLGYRAFLR